jgi:Domain of unknown function (DUF4062)
VTPSIILVQTVLISSVQRDYQDVRQAAREGVETLDYRALMAETVGAAPASSREALLEYVERTDVFLLIVGPRYGERGESGYSPTEEEFNHARQLGKPILVLVDERPRDAAARSSAACA